ncbi:MAG: NADPH:quinone oxidoreductase family protein [Acidimicrobiaceae bacterium]|jgi:NADPH:quinone reductase|nr:NADPH:quinone oxidoreductase family protein [Acidimicrobiaceae bacterium]MBT5581825.1 NADPH:quinone oxidoreductase family protein [Acidimicrobiaceae bacterium]MBT5850699.1 NADPH:quinone oxidoreductase family protein [Acidimicrobiaceae bacterium]
MRIWQSYELGDPIDVLRLEEAPDPEPGPGEVLIETQAVGLTFPDVLQCRGMYQVPTHHPYSPGGETSGIVAALGEGVEFLEVGTAVTFLGGGLAEKHAVRSMSCHAYPTDALSPAEAAAIPVNYGTTHFALHNRAQLQAGETVLITGAAGGTGTACIQLALAAGATPIAIVGGEEKAALVRSLGCELVVDHRATPAWVDTVREMSGGGVDVAYDAVGGDAFHQVRRCMAWDGRLLIIGFVGGIADAPTNHALLKNYSIVGVHWGASLQRDPESVKRQLADVFDLARQGKVKPALYPPVSFEQAARTLQDIAERKVSGKAVVDLAL